VSFISCRYHDFQSWESTLFEISNNLRGLNSLRVCLNVLFYFPIDLALSSLRSKLFWLVLFSILERLKELTSQTISTTFEPKPHPSPYRNWWPGLIFRIVRCDRLDVSNRLSVEESQRWSPFSEKGNPSLWPPNPLISQSRFIFHKMLEYSFGDL
jgi:hypothetical protein